MKLFHYQRPDGVDNFGDALNLWLWPRLLPGLMGPTPAGTLVGIGTLLNQRLPQRLSGAGPVFIFSTGAGYERPLRHIPQHWRMYCVRGPLSARQLGLAPALAIADGGILLRRCGLPAQYRSTPVAFMPHIHHATLAGEAWQEICRQLGYGYIDPRWPVDRVLAAIGQTQLLLAEAMHGAIAAEALRVPWVPVHTSARILGFKWQDWCAAIGVPYRPHYCPPLVAYPRLAQGVRSAGRAGRHWLQCLGQHPPSLWPPRSQAVARLRQIAQQAWPVLSPEGRLESLCDRLEEALARLRQDLTAQQAQGWPGPQSTAE